MTEKTPYTYTVLRYVHDFATAEFVNVGVVLHCPKLRYFDAKLRHTHGRFSDLFPDLDSRRVPRIHDFTRACSEGGG